MPKTKRGKRTKRRGLSSRQRNNVRGRRTKGGGKSVQADSNALFHPPLQAAQSSLLDVKYFDSSRALAAVTSAGVISKLTTITQGIGENQRIGDDLVIRQLQIRHQIQLLSTDCIVRYVIFQWLDDDTVIPTVAAVLTSTGTVADNPNTTYNASNIRQKKFAILADERFALSTAGVATHVSEFQRNIGTEVALNPALTTGTGHYYMLEVSNLAATPPSTAWVARVSYVDA